ncbi:MAG: hypothetical protein [Olavius algarvensis Gamma 3 endosymbiont]|nr:MAG: hypothetical protein [Olavius algarvensis Gamma 3 endosymbiont]
MRIYSYPGVIFFGAATSIRQGRFLSRPGVAIDALLKSANR